MIRRTNTRLIRFCPHSPARRQWRLARTLPTQATQELIIRLLAADTLPMVLDAEALNQLVGTLDVVRQRSQHGGEQR